MSGSYTYSLAPGEDQWKREPLQPYTSLRVHVPELHDAKNSRSLVTMENTLNGVTVTIRDPIASVIVNSFKGEAA